jgi:hypothetical protein
MKPDKESMWKKRTLESTQRNGDTEGMKKLW